MPTQELDVEEQLLRALTTVREQKLKALQAHEDSHYWKRRCAKSHFAQLGFWLHAHGDASTICCECVMSSACMAQAACCCPLLLLHCLGMSKRRRQSSRHLSSWPVWSNKQLTGRRAQWHSMSCQLQSAGGLLRMAVAWASVSLVSSVCRLDCYRHVAG